MSETNGLLKIAAVGASVLLWVAAGSGAQAQEQRVEEDAPRVEPVSPQATETVPVPSEGLQELQSPAEDAATQSSQSPQSPNFDYLVGAEDVLDVEVFGVPELSKTVRVANDGTISLPLLGHIKVAGLTTQQLRQELETRWGEAYLENPQVTVFVREFRAQPVSVIGAVERPGLYQLTGPRTLIEMLSMAGGLAKRTTANAGRTVIVTRRGGFTDLPVTEGLTLVAPDKVEIDLNRLLYARDERLNIGIRPLDSLAVSRADIVYVVGEVKKPGGFVLDDRENLTVLQALALAEGYTGFASTKNAVVIRRRLDGSRVEIPVNLSKLLKGQEEDLTLAANDILFVPRSGAKAALKRGSDAVIGTLSGILIYGRY